MSGTRWGLGGAVALVALVAGVQATMTYAGRGLWLGTASVVVLVLMDLAGMWSLWRARARLSSELAGMGQVPPVGTLVEGRRSALAAIHATGATPDVDALAQSIAARERGNAYLGRYMVAVTVLVGLVGTFAGLMETLRQVAPLLNDEKASALQIIAAPLAGLDVTFGASVVGILVTLALSLVQGDLVLAEEEALARLEDLSAHVLVPALWPPAQHPTARAADEVKALRHEMASLVENMAQAGAERVSRVADAALEKQAAMLEKVTREVLERTTTEVKSGVLAVAANVESALTPLFKAHAAALDATASDTRKTGEDTRAAITTATRELVSELGTLSKKLAARWDDATLAQQEALEKDARALQQARTEEVQAWRTQLHKLVDDTAQRLDAAVARIPAAVQTASDAMATSTRTAQEQVSTALSRHAELADAAAGQLPRAVTAATDALVAATRRAQEELAAHVKAHAERVDHANQQAREHLAALVGAQAELIATSARELPRAVTTATAQMVTSTEQARAEMVELVRAQSDVMQASARELPVVIRAAAERMVAATDDTRSLVTRGVESVVEAREQFTRDTAQHLDRMAAHAQQTADVVDKALHRVLEEHARHLEDATVKVSGALARGFGDATTKLDGAATGLAHAADRFRDGTADLAPAVQTLAPELAALSRELALLAARQDEQAPDNLVLEELARVGEGVERLQALLKLAQENRS